MIKFHNEGYLTLYNEFENHTFEITPASPRSEWVNAKGM